MINLINDLRELIHQYRATLEKDESRAVTSFFSANVIDIACALAELGIREGRPISVYEEYWYEGGVHMDYEFGNGPWGQIEKNYSHLINFVHEKNFFRSS